MKSVQRSAGEMTLAEVSQLVRVRKKEKAKIITSIRQQPDMIPELWDIFMLYTKMPGYVEHIRSVAHNTTH